MGSSHLKGPQEDQSQPPPGLVGEGEARPPPVGGRQDWAGWLRDSGAMVGSAEEDRQEEGSLPFPTLPAERRRGPHLRLDSIPSLTRNHTLKEAWHSCTALCQPTSPRATHGFGAWRIISPVDR